MNAIGTEARLLTNLRTLAGHGNMEAVGALVFHSAQTQDWREAAKWSAVAAQCTLDKASFEVIGGMVEARLKPAEIDEAHKSATRWIAAHPQIDCAAR